MNSAPDITVDGSQGTYAARRAELKTYFDRTAAEAWKKLTSDEAVSGIRAKVRAGRDAMRAIALDRLPSDLSGASVLDAGCGPGQFAIEAARRGAQVTGVDLSPTLISLAQARASEIVGSTAIHFASGDMLTPPDGEPVGEGPAYDFVVALDSLIHYSAGDMVDALARLAGRARLGVVATYAPMTPMLGVKHFVGGLFPRSDRAPEIRPVAPANIRKRIAAHPALSDWQVDAVTRVDTGFYVSEAISLVRKDLSL